MRKIGYAGYGITITCILRKETVWWNIITRRFEYTPSEYAIDFEYNPKLRAITHFSWKKSCFCVFEHDLCHILETRKYLCNRIQESIKELLINYKAGLNEG